MDYFFIIWMEKLKLVNSKKKKENNFSVNY